MVNLARNRVVNISIIYTISNNKLFDDNKTPSNELKRLIKFLVGRYEEETDSDSFYTIKKKMGITPIELEIMVKEGLLLGLINEIYPAVLSLTEKGKSYAIKDGITRFRYGISNNSKNKPSSGLVALLKYLIDQYQAGSEIETYFKVKKSIQITRIEIDLIVEEGLSFEYIRNVKPALLSLTEKGKTYGIQNGLATAGRK